MTRTGGPSYRKGHHGHDRQTGVPRHRRHPVRQQQTHPTIGRGGDPHGPNQRMPRVHRHGARPAADRPAHPIGFDGIISSAGARIDINGTLLQNRFLDKTAVTHVADVFDRLGINHLWQSSRGLWTSPGYLRLIERIRRDIDPGYGATNGGPSRSHDRTPHDRACPWARSCRHRNARSTPHPVPRSPSTRSAGSSAIGCTSSKDPWASTRPPTERA